MFESLEDRRLLAAANAEFLVELQTHGVPRVELDLLEGLVHLEPPQHLSLLVAPLDDYHAKDGDGVSKDGDVAQENPDFIYRSYYDNFVLTIGAGSEYFVPPIIFGDLVPELNRTKDIAYHDENHRRTLDNDYYSSTRAWVNDLIRKTTRVCTDCLDYDVFPEFLRGKGYNSNSFIAGLLSVTNTALPDGKTDPSDVFPGLQSYPGWNTPVPDSEFLPAADDNNPSVVQVIDRSGSMAGPKLAAAKTAAAAFVELMQRGDEIGIVSYSSSARADYPLTEITDSQVKEEAKSAVARLLAGGRTSIGSGLQMADDQLDRFSTNSGKAIVIMTDGKHNEASDPIAVIKQDIDSDIKIFAIGFGGDADTDRLTQIAEMRSGQFFFAASALELQQIYTQIAGQVGSRLGLLNVTGTLDSLQTVTYYFVIDPSVDALYTGVNFGGSDLDLELLAPDGTVISHEVAATDPDIDLAEGPTFEFVTVRLPQYGQWGMRVIAVDVPPAGEPYNAFATADSSVTSSLRLVDPITGEPKLSFKTGDTAGIQLEISDGTPLRGALVIVTVLPPAGTGFPVVVTLLDDGEHADNAADDGVYGNTFDQLFYHGSYRFDADVSGKATVGFSFQSVDSVSNFVTGDPIQVDQAKVESITYFNRSAAAEQNYSTDDTGQRSMVRRIQIIFDGPINVPLGPVADDSFMLDNLDVPSNIPLEVVSSELIGGKQAVTVQPVVPDPEVEQSGSLVNGNYRLTVDGNILGVDADGDGTPGGQATDEFFRLFGDSNGDGRVSGPDLRAFRRYTRSGEGMAVFDYDNDGKFRRDDTRAFRMRRR